MADIVTRRELENAKIDAKDLGEAVNEKVIVSPRYGEDFKSLPMLAAQAQSEINEWGEAIQLITQEDGVPALAVSDASGVTQQDINDLTGAPYRVRVGGYNIGERVVLENGDIVQSVVDGNTVDPNLDMTGWVNPQKEQATINDYSVNVDSFARYNTNGSWYNALDKAFDKIIAKGGGTLIFNPHEYILKTPFHKQVPDGIKINVVGFGANINATSIKGTVDGDTVIFRVGGYVMTSSQLSANAARMTSNLSLASNMSLTKGNILKIVSTDLFEPSRPYYVKGEFVQVVSSTSNSAVLAGATYDSYNASTTRAEKLAMPEISINGLDIQCDANQIGLQLEYVRNPDTSGCTINGARYSGISYKFCLGGSVHKNIVSDGWYSGSGTSYNIVFDSSQDCDASFNLLTEGRHNIASGGTLPCRNIKYLYNSAKTHPSNGNFNSIDAHSNGEFFQIIGNTCDGIGVGARNIKIKDNTIRSNKGTYQQIVIQPSLNDGTYEIEGNIVEGLGADVNAIFFAPVLPNITTRLLSIKGGSAESSVAALLIKPRVATASNNIIESLVIENTTLRGFAVDKISSGGNTATITINDFVSRNMKLSKGSFVVTADNIINKWRSIDDSFFQPGANTTIAQIRAKDVGMIRPVISGESASIKARSFQFADCDKVKLIDPDIRNTVIAIELLSNVGKYIESGRTVKDSPLTILNTAGAAIGESETRNGNLILSATAIPTVGGYTVGDYIRNTANTIVTGTPNKRLIGWYRATTGSSHVLGTDWIAEYSVLS